VALDRDYQRENSGSDELEKHVVGGGWRNVTCDIDLEPTVICLATQNRSLCRVAAVLILTEATKQLPLCFEIALTTIKPAITVYKLLHRPR